MLLLRSSAFLLRLWTRVHYSFDACIHHTLTDETMNNISWSRLCVRFYCSSLSLSLFLCTVFVGHRKITQFSAFRSYFVFVMRLYDSYEYTLNTAVGRTRVCVCLWAWSVETDQNERNRCDVRNLHTRRWCRRRRRIHVATKCAWGRRRSRKRVHTAPDVSDVTHTAPALSTTTLWHTATAMMMLPLPTTLFFILFFFAFFFCLRYLPFFFSDILGCTEFMYIYLIIFFVWIFCQVTFVEWTQNIYGKWCRYCTLAAVRCELMELIIINASHQHKRCESQ